ncbi:MAG: hypothetical protein FWG07_02990 [Treponema sp.]|nr:hypothetical protein [Treponema sp.]
MKIRKLPIFLFLIFILSAPLFGQTAAKVEALLNKTELTWLEVTAFVLEASEAGIFRNEQEAFNLAAGNKWLPKKAESIGTAQLQGVALLLMRSFNLQGGIFYSMTKSPHHAYRELVFKKVIRGTTDPLMSVSGRDLLLMTGRLLAMRENAAEGALQ